MARAMNKYNIASEYLKNCSYCHDADASFQCSNCERAKYCDRKCQKDHWPLHKSECREFAQERLRNNQTPQATTLNEEAKRAEKFIESVYQDDIEEVKTYIDNNGNVNYRSVRNDDQKKMIFRGDTGLMVSSTHNKVKIASFLLMHGADVNAKAKAKKDNCTALHTSNTREMTLLLLENGAEVNGTDNDKDTALHRACICSRTEMVLLLLSRGAGINLGNKRKWTPLHIACQQGNEEIVTVLINHGANIEAQDISGATALHFAANFNHSDVIKILVKQGAKCDTLDSEARTPLITAAANGTHQYSHCFIR